MPLNILIAPDKFKGSLTAQAAAEAIAVGWRRARPQDTLVLLPIADGGDGFGAILGQLLGAQPRRVATVDAAQRPREGVFWWEAQTRTAVIESAQVIGLAQLPAGRYHPFELDTFGLGALLRGAGRLGARRCLVGVGGSATNDAGFGLARALGWRFFNRLDREIVRWTELHGLGLLQPPASLPAFEDLAVAVDVRNPLLGSRGCTRIFGPQKGLGPDDFEFAERCLQRLADVVARGAGNALHLEPGSGAAGGLAFGLRCFAGARVESGFDLFARCARLTERLGAADLVVTGEGSLDEASLMGKGVGELAVRCQAQGRPCVAVAGCVRIGPAGQGFADVQALTPDLTTPECAMGEGPAWVAAAAERLGRRLDAAGRLGRWERVRPGGVEKLPGETC